jgi:two-component system, NarL family, invasion response regulator UvrY
LVKNFYTTLFLETVKVGPSGRWQIMHILIIDCHTMMREGLREMIRKTVEGATIGEAADKRELLEVVRAMRWDVALLNIDMPGRGGLDILKHLRSEHPKLPILAFSMHAKEGYALRTVRAGAAGYLDTKSAPEELVRAIHKLALGRKHLSTALAERLASEFLDGFQAPAHEALSDREYQIMIMLASGKMIKQVAAELSLSAKTICAHHCGILRKMRMESDAELTLYAFRNRLVD